MASRYRPMLQLVKRNKMLTPRFNMSLKRQTLIRPCYTMSERSAEPIQKLLHDFLSVPSAGNSKWIPESDVQFLCNYYKRLSDLQKKQFLFMLAVDGSTDHSAVLEAAQNLQTAQSKGEAAVVQAEARIKFQLSPRYHTLLSHIGRIHGGVKFLVDLRADLLRILADHSRSTAEVLEPDHNIRALNTTLHEMLSHWFSAGLLNQQRITWKSSCDMLEKISQYEAVHPIHDWTDIKQRVGPYRRCFVFTHNSMPDEPVVVLHTALMRDIPESIQAIVQSQWRNSKNSHPALLLEWEDPSEARAAIFYSITSTQQGLKGIELGTYLIKSVVKELRQEFRKMDVFSSLSPIPGFRSWLFAEINKEIKNPSAAILFTATEMQRIKELSKSEEVGLQLVKELLSSTLWAESKDLTAAFRQPLLRLCARYLYSEKHRGFALNPVANFHLRNGAVLWRINWMGDNSPRGLSQSCGLMVNYRYFLDQTSDNSKEYVETKRIQASSQVHQLLRQGGDKYTFNSRL